MMAAAVDITWVFLLTIYMAINALLWSVTYSEIRALHTREEVQDLVDISLQIIDQCSERWPGTGAASQLYSTFAKACLQSYESRNTPALTNASTYDTPSSQSETNSPPRSEILNSAAASKPNAATFHPPHFGSVFDTTPEPVTDFGFDNPFASQPTFRSNSIFHNPATSDHTGRRFSYFPPDFTQHQEALLEEATPPASETTMSPPVHSPPQHSPTPPGNPPSDAGGPPAMDASIVATPLMPAQNLPHASSPDVPLNAMPHQTPPQQQQPRQQPQQSRPTTATFTVPTLPPQQQAPGQRPLPQPNTITDWFNPPPPFISPYTFSSTGGGLWGANSNPATTNGHSNGGNSGLVSPSFSQFSSAAGLPPERQGSLSQEQQMELFNVLENEGMTDIDAYLNMANMNNMVDVTSAPAGAGVPANNNGAMNYTNGGGGGGGGGNAMVNPNAQVNWGGRP